MILIKIADGTDDDLRSLFTYLRTKEDLDGLIQFTADPSADHLSGFADALTAAVGAGGLVSILVSTVAIWLRGRSSDVKVTFTKKGEQQTIELTSNRIRGIDAARLGEIVRDVATAIGPADDDTSS